MVNDDKLLTRLELMLFGVFASLATVYVMIPRVVTNENLAEALVQGLLLFLPAMALASAYRAYRKSTQLEKRAWAIVAVASGFMLAGCTYRLLHMHSPLGMLASAGISTHALLHFFADALFITALLAMPGFKLIHGFTRIRALLDTLIVTTIFLVFSWFYLPKLVPLQAGIGSGQWFEGVHTVVSVMIIFGLLGNAIGLRQVRWRRSEIQFALALVFLALADLTQRNVFGGHSALGSAGSLIEIVRMGGFFMIVVSSLFAVEQPGSIAAEPRSSLGHIVDLLIPVISGVSIPTLAFISYFRGTVMDYPIFLTAFTIVCMLIVIRTAVLIAESNQLFENSVVDFLTGLYNHRFFKERLAIEVDRANRHGDEMSLAIINLDNFSRVNNIFGHTKGDQDLKEIAQKLTSSVRSVDTICRVGGDEFAVIMPNTNVIDAYKVCLKLQNIVAEVGSSQDAEASASIGISGFPSLGQAELPATWSSMLEREEVERRAKGALYWAKQHGKSQVLIYDPEVIETIDAEDRIQKIQAEAYLNTVQALAVAVDARDPNTQFHAKNVSVLASNLAHNLGMSSDQVRLIEIAALLHDVGKLGVPDGILRKPGALNSDERQEIEAHIAVSEQILSQTALKEIIPWVIAHHERWNGEGYPRGMAGEEIPFEARILTICDAYEAMTSDRPYRKALGHNVALGILNKESGQYFDPTLVGIFHQIFEGEGVVDAGDSTQILVARDRGKIVAV